MPSMSSAGEPGLRPSGRTPRAQQDGLHELPCLGDPNAVALGQQIVERTVFEVRREQSGEPLGGQVDLLKQQRLAGGEAQSLKVEDGRPELELERVGDGLARRLRPRGDQAGLEMRPRTCISSVKDSSPAKSRSIRGCSTNVPRPRVRSRRCSRTSSPRARRIVMRLQP